MLLKYSNLFCQRFALTCSATGERAVHKSSIRSKAKVLDGLKISKNICLELKAQIEEWVRAGNRPPKLVAVLVGDDPSSAIYVRNKMKTAKELGVTSVKLNFPDNITQSKLIEHIESLNSDPAIDGILVQLPLPTHIDEGVVGNTVVPEKDVDGFNAVNIGRLCLDLEGFIPCSVLGVREIIKHSGIETLGKNAVICGRSKNVGMPIAMLLHSDGHNGKGVTLALDATTTICHRYTPHERLTELTKSADIIVTAAGIPNMITADMVKEGACVIDIGFNRIKSTTTGKTKLVGDVDYEGVRKIAGFITPVPGGVGPVTVAMLMKNTLLAAKKLIKFEQAKH